MSETTFPKFGKIERMLSRESSTAQARSDAFAFAVRCQADINCIQEEIASQEALIQSVLNSSSFGSNNPMHPGSGPRVFRDAYLSGLRDAIALILSVSESESG